MQGLSLASIKKHPSLIPLFGVMLFGGGAAILYTIRLAVRSPEASWNKRNNPEPWNEYANKRYKFLNPLGVEETKCPAPKY